MKTIIASLLCLEYGIINKGFFMSFVTLCTTSNKNRMSKLVKNLEEVDSMANQLLIHTINVFCVLTVKKRSLMKQKSNQVPDESFEF